MSPRNIRPRNKMRARFVALAVVSSVAGLLLTGGAAAPVDTPPPASVENPLTEVDTTLPGVAERIAQIQANGGEILGGSSVDYTPDTTDGPTMRTQGYPSGCGLTVLIYQQVAQIVSDNLTSCTAPFGTAAMSSTIGFLAWGTYNNFVASKGGSATGAYSLAVEYAFNCKNRTNTTWFRTVTNGTLVRGGTTYSAAAYDDAQSTSCGT